jgi:antitoxin component of MazEF toxin-antitoxin module
MERKPVDGFILQVERRRKLGLPADVLEQAELHPGDHVQVRVRADHHLAITRMTTVMDKYSGATPGLAAATNLPELRSQ